MEIYLVHSSKYDFKKELYQPIKESSLVQKHTFIFLYDGNQNPSSTKDIIKNVDLVIAEVSYPSIGSGIELGWADAFHIPIICIHKRGKKISRFLKMLTNNILVYNDQHDLIKTLKIAVHEIVS